MCGFSNQDYRGVQYLAGWSQQRRQSGVAALEFAIVSAIFFLVLFATVEFARFLYDINLVRSAVYAGVRYASVRGKANGPVDIGQIKSYVNDRSNGIISIAHIAVETCTDNSCSAPSTWPANADPGNRVRITGEVNFAPVFAHIPLPTSISSSATLIIRQ